MIAILVAAALQGAPAWAGDKPGWEYQATSTDGKTALYARLGPDSTKVWIRTELRAADEGILSTRSLVEVDCATRRTRTLQLTAFAGRGLSGDIVGMSSEAPWDYAAPDTFADQYLWFACGA